ncbi:unnamed protein product [Acanthoscelides obtectus]|uniref:Uncharacterized protein n=1 Tax=Acanthoscelides obtectus TaxID=200917 RepID=A0A9P0QG11_ACAOB|nr:unnamed protein product [Acanthoscelides obtectus]CAK1682460.1 hypothetical protein AOBTE_LOCUS33645 [Acanthoscelides obtectus]
MKSQNLIPKDEDDSEHELKIDEDNEQLNEEPEIKPHPMENKVFVWNDIMVPMDIEVDDSIYEYTEDKVDDNVSLDLSTRTQSPMDSESSFVGQEVSQPVSGVGTLLCPPMRRSQRMVMIFQWRSTRGSSNVRIAPSGHLQPPGML